MFCKRLNKIISILIIVIFFFTNINISYASSGSKSLFKNKKVDYDKISSQSQDNLEKRQSVIKGEDAKEIQSQQKEAKKILSSHLEDISQIHIPQELGRIVEVHQGTVNKAEGTTPLIVGIQDLHTNPEAELNLAKILELLLKDYDMGLICSEGAIGKVDTSTAPKFPTKDITEKVCRVFINSGELTGEEYLSITKYPDLPIWGIETKDIYFNNIISFNRIMKFSLSSQVFILQVKKAITELKPKVYSKDLLDLDQKESEFNSQKLDTAKYIKYLLDSANMINSHGRSKNIDNILFERGAEGTESRTAKYKNIFLLKETMEMEKHIDQARIMNDSQNLLLNLQSTLHSKSLNSDLDGLMARASLFKDQKISPFSFYSYLKDLALKHHIIEIASDVDSGRSPRNDNTGVIVRSSDTKGVGTTKQSKYPALMDFIDYLTKVNSLDSTKLFTELEDLNFEIKEALSKTDEQKTLVKADHNINFLESFFNLKVSNEDLDYYLNNKDSHKVAFFKDFLPKTLKKYNLSPEVAAGFSLRKDNAQERNLKVAATYVDYNPALIDSHLQELEDFYKVVKDRDIAMVNNSLSEIEKRNVKLATLVHGGFHTKGITKLLKEKGYSYIIVSPYSKTDMDEENYHFLLSGRRKPITELIKQLDISNIVNKLLGPKTLRLPLTFNIAAELFEKEVAPALARLGVTTEVLSYDPIQTRMRELGVLAALNEAGRLVANSTNLDAVIAMFIIAEEKVYVEITRDGKVRKVAEADFNAGKRFVEGDQPGQRVTEPSLGKTAIQALGSTEYRWKNRPVWFFDDKPKAEEEEPDRGFLGGKGGGLREMTQAGLPVPRGYTITTEVCNTYLAKDITDEELLGLNQESMAKLEARTGKKFGNSANPLLVSVRSGAKFSMPGMMDTVLNVGLNDETVKGLAELTQDERFAYDSYRRLIQMFGKVVMGVDGDLFEEAIAEKKKQRNIQEDTELTAEDWKGLVGEFKTIIKSQTNKEFPQDPYEQLHLATQAVFKSWLGARAKEYRSIKGISEDLGTAVNVVTMVFGNMGEDSGTGVAFTRNTATGEQEFYGDFLLKAQGEDVVAGIRTPLPIARMAEVLPEVYQQLLKVAALLEKTYGDVQDIEFTIEHGKLWMLQTRRGQRTPQAALRIAIDMHNEGLIDAEEALMRVSPEQLEILLHPMFDTNAVEGAKKAGRFLTKGADASPGAGSGRIALSAKKAVEMAKGGLVILVRPMTEPADVAGINASKGVLTSTGGKTSHAAVVTRGFGIPCIVGAGEIRIDEEKGEVYVGGKVFKEGDWISIDGGTGEVFEGKLDTVPSPIIQYALEPDQEKAKKESPLYAAYLEIMALADKQARLGAWANADTGKDAKTARALGAKGIGLARTEHMFLGDRLPAVQRMLLGALVGDSSVRDKAIEEILPLQKQDFLDLFEAMDGLPVIIRLLDPPLHEFLPKLDDEERIRELAKETNRSVDEIQRILKEISEENPMFGYRGVRLLLHFPEIAKMQARAIIEAAIEAQRGGINVLPKIMVPVVSEPEEYRKMHALIKEVVDEVLTERGVRLENGYKIGTMIEITRATLLADRIIEDGAEFFSFGTNDLTQSTLGLSRDDVGFIQPYQELGIYPVDPFKTVDNASVGVLIALTKMLDSKGIEVGICGEHGGDPATIELLHNAGLNYASASPFRVPIARLATAQAVIRERRGEVDKSVQNTIATAKWLKDEVIPAVREGKSLVEPRPTTTQVSVTSHKQLSIALSEGNKSINLDLTKLILGNENLMRFLRRAVLLGMAVNDKGVLNETLERITDEVKFLISDIVEKEELERISIDLLDISLFSLVSVPEGELDKVAKELGIEKEELVKRSNSFKEANPAFGERGARLLVSRAEGIFLAQIYGIFDAVKKLSGKPTLQINIPFVSEIGELQAARSLVERVATDAPYKGILYKLGIILETPKALMVAGKLVETGLADALVLDLLDLTQSGWGMTIKDAQGFLKVYLEQEIITANPFETLDREGILILIADAIRQARAVKPDIPIEVTGPQLSDTKSREILSQIGIDIFILTFEVESVLKLVETHHRSDI